MKTVETYTAQIFVGLRNGYSEEIQSMDIIKAVCSDYVQKVGLCVTVTPTEFIYKSTPECPHCGELGAIIGLINYPRFPSDASAIEGHVISLASRLKKVLKQNRVSIVFHHKTIMVERSFE